MLARVQPGELWIADRNFCTRGWLWGLHARGAVGLVREHAQMPFTPLEARRVVVPEPTCDEWRVIAENARSADMVDFLAGAAAYGLWLREHSRAIPADRVLGEGEGLNKKIREAYMEGHFDGVQWSGQDEEDANKEADWQASSALHAIRANQGGAAT